MTIAGSDSSGGAGIQADIKTFNKSGVNDLSVITAVTAQNKSGVLSYFALPPSAIDDQLKAVFEGFEIGAVKTGMLANREIVETVAGFLRRAKVKNLIVDPVIKSSKGDTLLENNAIEVLAKHLFPLALVVVPNVDEASALSGVKVKNIQTAREAAQIIYRLGAKHVLIKGGHLEDKFSTDLLYDGNIFTEFSEKRVINKDLPSRQASLHGSGCIFSASITAQLAKGQTLENAIRTAKTLITKKLTDK